MLLNIEEKLRHTKDAIDVIIDAVGVNERQIKTQHGIDGRNTYSGVAVNSYCIITVTCERLIQKRNYFIADPNIIMLGNHLADACVLCIFNIFIIMRGKLADDCFA